MLTYFMKQVREALSRRLETTSVWARWKQCLGKKSRYRDGGRSSEDRTRLELLMPQTNSAAVSFFSFSSAIAYDRCLVFLEKKCHWNRRPSIGNQCQWNS